MQAGAGGDDGKAGGFEVLHVAGIPGPGSFLVDLVGKETAGLAGLACLGCK